MDHSNVNRVGQRRPDGVKEVVAEVHAEVGRALHIQQIQLGIHQPELYQQVLLDTGGKESLDRPVKVV